MTSLTPSPSFSLTVRLEIPNRAGQLAAILQAIGAAGGNLGQINLVDQTRQMAVREITIDAISPEHEERLIETIRALPQVRLLSVDDRTFKLHQGGKIHLQSKIALKNRADLAMAYTPGVGRVCTEIAQNPDQVYRLTIKQNCVAIVTDGSAVLGLGNLGPQAALPVMEGKAMLFKEFAGIDAFPICLDTQDTDAIVNTVKYLAPVFGGINLEDISAPRCFEIEQRLQKELAIPVFHDDQHGTAVVTLAALLNALRWVGKSLERVRVVINGAGAAGLAVAGLLQRAGAQGLVLCDSQGIVSTSRPHLHPTKAAFAVTQSGTLADALVEADVFLGLSVPGAVTPEMVLTMAVDPVVFAMANPVPEIQPELVEDKVAVMATGRSDYPNQINNVLAFPGIFRGALDSRVRHLTPELYLAAARAIASLVAPQELQREYIVPSVFDSRVVQAVAQAVAQAARESGLTQG
ncbi:malic enzyme, NAD-binding [Gloeomargarita lithophora Alchichica-D10]|uniref:Malic enzyme, NAD-binding n=1 Tax=Gloeomargarita lithophora Alchichica-D10 TaxID=1188229 RepID=A0A1J0A9S1_9CYAN|nr:NAD-dependent malic enzyme [Gloeomargarita lithophora]APB32671.1 malic enzyme, NAD-binding [Gloeomargarita lithophora Alchichica-D10]